MGWWYIIVTGDYRIRGQEPTNNRRTIQREANKQHPPPLEKQQSNKVQLITSKGLKSMTSATTTAKTMMISRKEISRKFSLSQIYDNIFCSSPLKFTSDVWLENLSWILFRIAGTWALIRVHASDN